MKQLIGTRVLILPEDPNTTTSGIIINGSNATQKLRPFKGEIAFIGHNVTEVNPGDIVKFKEMNGKEFSHNGVNYIMVQEQDIEGIYGN